MFENFTPQAPGTTTVQAVFHEGELLSTLIVANFGTEDARDAVVASFPASQRKHLQVTWIIREGIKVFRIMATVNLRSNSRSGEVNETGLKRARRLLAAVREQGSNVLPATIGGNDVTVIEG